MFFRILATLAMRPAEKKRAGWFFGLELFSELKAAGKSPAILINARLSAKLVFFSSKTFL